MTCVDETLNDGRVTRPAGVDAHVLIAGVRRPGSGGFRSDRRRDLRAIRRLRQNPEQEHQSRHEHGVRGCASLRQTAG